MGHSNYGIAMANILANKDANIVVYLEDAERARSFNFERTDTDHYPLFKLPPNVEFTASPDVLDDATLFVQATLPWNMKKVYTPIADRLAGSKATIVNVMKGFADAENGLILDVLESVFGINPSRMAVLSGANHPDQIMERKISGFDVAAPDSHMLTHLTGLFSTGYIYARPAVNPADVRGVQLGGALKNVYALGIGLLDAYYENTLGGNSDSSLFHLSNRIFREMTGLGVAMGGQESTFTGLSGLTDLMYGCFGRDAYEREIGRNWINGQRDTKMKSAGVYGLRFLAKSQDPDPQKYPVFAAICAIIVDGHDPEKVLERAMYELRRY